MRCERNKVAYKTCIFNSDHFARFNNMIFDNDQDYVFTEAVKYVKKNALIKQYL